MSALVLALLFAETMSLSSAMEAAPSAAATAASTESDDDEVDQGRLLRGGATVAATSGCGAALGLVAAGAAGLLGISMAFSIGGGYGFDGVPPWVPLVVLGASAALALGSPALASLAAAALGDLVTGATSTWWVVVVVGGLGAFAAVVPALALAVLPFTSGLALPLFAVGVPVFAGAGAAAAWLATARWSPRESSSSPEQLGRPQLDPPMNRSVAIAY